MQPDPNDTGLLVSALNHQSESYSPVLDAFDGLSLYGDGLNLYSYEAGNPVTGLDPEGLFSLVELSLASAFSADWDANNFDTGMSLLDAMAGLAGAMSDRNLMLEELTGMAYDMPDLTGVDMALSVYSLYQTVQLARFGGGIVKLGATLAAKGFGKLAKGVGNLGRRARGGRLPMALRVLNDVCFAAGTPILMADGSIAPIEGVRPGDQVLCDCDPESDNGPEACLVVRRIVSWAPAVMTIDVDSPGGPDTLRVTPEHPLYDYAADRYVAAGSLRAGDMVPLAGGASSRISRVDRTEGRVRVYNLEVEGAHNYFVGVAEEGPWLLAHNRCVRHHLVPKAVREKLSPEVRNHPLVKGRRGSPNRWYLPEELHKILHGKGATGGAGARGGPWNQRWWEELPPDPRTASVDEVLQIREQLVREFGLEMFRP